MKLNSANQAKANQMVCDMRGIVSLETEIKIAEELVKAGWVKMPEKTDTQEMTTLNMRIQRDDNLNTVVYDDTVGAGNGRHYYEVERNGETLAKIQFQHGARNEQGSTAGVLETDLLEIVRHRLQCFQDGEYRTRENACALTHIEEALMWMNKRTADRKERGVLGTMGK